MGLLMDKLAYRNGSYTEVFADFLDYQIACFLVTGDKELAERLEKKYQKDYHYFDELLKEHLYCLDRCIGDDFKWFDALGAIYETISSKWKSSSMGQFFTPPTLVDMMSKLTLGDMKKGAGKRILDNCCGSGRMLIAAHASSPGNYQFGADLDPICTKMTAINMLLHGCVGEASCMDSLKYEWNFGYQVNSHLGWSKVPTLLKLNTFEDSYFYVTPKKEAPRGEYVPARNMPIILPSGQMSLF